MEKTKMPRSELIEGYAAIFGREDQAGDVVRAGAFSRSLKRSGGPPMLLQHRPGAIAGRWVRLIEDGRGLYVRGLVDNETALRLARDGLNGLSIGFRPRLWKARAGPGRELIDLDLVEISLVSEPMQGVARFRLLAA
ncbi:MAG: HK97 family phage prohead protease [Pseudomonadota bacterium]